MHVMQQVSFSLAGGTFFCQNNNIVYEKISRFVFCAIFEWGKILYCITKAHYVVNIDTGNKLGRHVCHGTCHHLSNFDISAVSTHAVILARQTRGFKSKHMHVYIYCMQNFPYILSFTDWAKKNLQKAVIECIFCSRNICGWNYLWKAQKAIVVFFFCLFSVCRSVCNKVTQFLRSDQTSAEWKLFAKSKEKLIIMMSLCFICAVVVVVLVSFFFLFFFSEGKFFF